MTQNVAASVHQRLLNRARAEGRLFNELLQYFAMERFLYRLGAMRADIGDSSTAVGMTGMGSGAGSLSWSAPQRSFSTSGR